MKAITNRELDGVTGGKIPLGAKIPIFFGLTAAAWGIADGIDKLRGVGRHEKDNRSPERQVR